MKITKKESTDTEPSLYIKNLTEDWASIYLTAPKHYKTVKNIHLNKIQSNQVWVETDLLSKQDMHWLPTLDSQGFL